MNPAKTTDGLIQLLEERGTSDFIGESISQLEHSLQCANFGRKSAALLHDIGQFLPLDAAEDVQMGVGDYSVGRVGHEIIGEEYLKQLGFGEKVSRLVGSHVAAQRYLTEVDSEYYDELSEASKQSLIFQGGPFQGEELEVFKRDPLKDEMVKLRKWDDQAKVVGIVDQIPRAESYRDMMKKHLEAVYSACEE